jgi:hypothetical protein
MTNGSEELVTEIHETIAVLSQVIRQTEEPLNTTEGETAES